MEAQIEYLRTLLARVHDLNSAAAVLEWDQETYMPEGATEARAHQIATLRQLAHEYFTADEVGRLLEELAPVVAPMDPAATEAALVRVTQRDYGQARRIPPELVAETARAVTRAKQAWKEARETDTFATFAPHLARVVELNVRKAEALGYEERRYDALLDQYEPGMRTATVEQVFADLREALVPVVHAIAEREPPHDDILRQRFERDTQWDFGMAVLRDVGYDFARGRQDLSAHPFTTTFDVTDVRITTRLDEQFFSSAFFGTLHEAGHALYEQGVDPALARTPLAEGTSLAMHESQSRLWENLVGRSRPFWQHYYPLLQERFANQLGNVSLDTFYRAINKVAPSLIRVEADEVTYNLHIMVRFELELAMVEGHVAMEELPALWNEKMEAYLGRRPTHDAEGVLQDVHWSLGAIGYFPTYALGNLMSAQLFRQARHDLGDLDEQLAGGHFAALLGWLRTHVHRYGRALSAEAILRRVTGEGLQADSWLAYIREKYGALYGPL